MSSKLKTTGFIILAVVALQLSVFILTHNSEKYLDRIILKLKKACDEIVVVDSGSTDQTKNIAVKNNTRFIDRHFDNFKNQRAFATGQCSNDWVLMVDSDEVPDDELVESLLSWKEYTPEADAYRIPRMWHVLGKKVHAVYPVVSPDYPIRLFDKRISDFSRSPVVHEEPSGFRSLGVLSGTLFHYTFESKKEITGKLEQYTTLSAQTLLNKKKNLSMLQQWLSSAAAFVKWYFAKGGWKDGWLGIRLAKYAFDYTFLKYTKAKKLRG